MTADPTGLPADLPHPTDDGAAAHLSGARVPAVALPATDGRRLSLTEAATLRTVVYAFPWIAGADGRTPTDDWDRIPGARGCTPEACGFRDHAAELAALGAGVVGISTQPLDRLREAAERLRLPFPLLCDERMLVADALRLPRFEAGGRTLLRRLTMVVRDGIVERVWYPVFPPDAHAGAVTDWLRSSP